MTKPAGRDLPAYLRAEFIPNMVLAVRREQFTLEQAMQEVARECLKAPLAEVGDTVGQFAPQRTIAGYVERVRRDTLEEAAKAIEPANHPLLIAAAQAIRALKTAAPAASQIADPQSSPETDTAATHRNKPAESATRCVSETPLSPLERLAIEVLDASRENMTDVDGGWLQDKATDLGILVETRVTEACNEEFCACAEYGFPSECYRYTDAVQARRVQFHNEQEKPCSE